MVLAIGSGSLMLSHVNDSGFWLFKEYFNLSVKDTLLTWTVMETSIGISGLTAILTWFVWSIFIYLIGDKLFRASVELPKDINEGTYEVSIYFFEDQELIDRDVSSVFVNKTLAGKYIYTQANERPLLYGIICVIIAWIAGLLVAGLSRVR